MPTSTAWSRTGSERLDPRPEAAEQSALEAALSVLTDVLPGGTEARGALLEAMAEARLAADAAGDAEAARPPVATLVSEALIWSAVRLEPPTDVDGVMGRIAEYAEIDRDALALDVAARTLGDARVAALPPPAAIEAVLTLLRIVAPVVHVSLWRRGEDAAVHCVHFAGPGCPSRSVREAARHRLHSGPNGSRRGLLQIAGVPGRDEILVARVRPRAGGRAPAFLSMAARTLGPALDRASELERYVPQGEMLANAGERRIARIGFDLHDGPIQTLAALIGDTRLVDSQVADLLAGDSRGRVVRGRVADLKARMVALEFELRCMCHSLESPTVLCRPFERVMQDEVVTFQRRTGITPSVELSGHFQGLTPSQRIALLRVVQETLRNICEHSDARSVMVRIQVRRGATEAVVEDDGSGFDVDAALARAVRDGRVGLIGMIERVRLLGGRCEVRSRVGGPSTVSVLLPAWTGGGRSGQAPPPGPVPRG